MPGCTIQLSAMSPLDFTKQCQDDPAFQPPYLAEKPAGTFTGLTADATYYAFVVQDPALAAQDREVAERQKVILGEAVEVERVREEATGGRGRQGGGGGGEKGDSDDDELDEKYREFDELKDVWAGEPDKEAGDGGKTQPGQETAPGQSLMPGGVTEGSGGGVHIGGGGWR